MPELLVERDLPPSRCCSPSSAAWHHTLVLRAADLRPDHHLARRNDEGTRAGQGREGVRERERATAVRGRALLSGGRAASRPRSPPYLGLGSPRIAGLHRGASAIDHDGLVQHGGGRRGRSAAGRGVLCQHQRLWEAERPPHIMPSNTAGMPARPNPPQVNADTAALPMSYAVGAALTPPNTSGTPTLPTPPRRTPPSMTRAQLPPPTYPTPSARP